MNLFATPSNKVASPAQEGLVSTFNLLVSLPYDSQMSAIMKKVSTDYRRKSKSGIRCQSLLVQDSFEIVELAKSQI